MPYDYEDEESSFSWSDLAKPYNIGLVLVIIILIGSFWYPAKSDETVKMNTLTIVMTIALFGIWSAKSMWAILKYSSPQLVTQTIHGSTSGDPVITAGIWRVYNLGTIRYGLEIPGSEGTMITCSSILLSIFITSMSSIKEASASIETASFKCLKVSCSSALKI